MAEFITNVFQAHQLIGRMTALNNQVEEAARTLSDCILKGGTVYIIGNGGSASDADHFAGELVGRFYKERKGMPCVALNTSPAILTSIGNDYGYDAIFERQLEALFTPHLDILITMSTSGKSSNIIRSLEYISEIEGKAINLLGKDGGTIGMMHEFQNIIIPSIDTPRIQEMHMLILHYFAEHIEERWVNKDNE